MSAKRKPKEEKVYDRKSHDLPINSVVAIAVVTDPAGDKIEVLRSLRNDPLAGMLSRQQIDQAQFEAGRKWQRLHQISTIGVIMATDPAKEAVDGGRISESLTDKQIMAFSELADAYKALGGYGKALIFYVLGEEISITDAAARLNCTTAREIDYISRRFRECLETLAIHWGFAAPKYSR